MLRVVGEFFAVIEICRIARYARSLGASVDRGRARTRVGADDAGDNMQMQLLRHERTQLPGANGRGARAALSGRVFYIDYFNERRPPNSRTTTTTTMTT